MSSLKDKFAFVTGASGGIGRATAQELARRGATVAIHYFRNKAGAEETAKLIADESKDYTTNGHKKVTIYTGDLSKPAVAKELVAQVEKDLGRIDILINNAGDLVQRLPLIEMTPELWTSVMDTNVTSAVFCSQAVAPAMTKRKSGIIVNMASLAAWNGGGPGALAYAAAKGAVVSLTKAIAKELAPHGVRVNAVSPGLIGETNFHGRFTAREAFDNMTKTIPLGRAGRPDEVGKVIAFLCGDDSSFLSGETIEINGGMYMR